MRAHMYRFCSITTPVLAGVYVDSMRRPSTFPQNVSDPIPPGEIDWTTFRPTIKKENTDPQVDWTAFHPSKQPDWETFSINSAGEEEDWDAFSPDIEHSDSKKRQPNIDKFYQWKEKTDAKHQSNFHKQRAQRQIIGGPVLVKRQPEIFADEVMDIINPRDSTMLDYDKEKIMTLAKKVEWLEMNERYREDIRKHYGGITISNDLPAAKPALHTPFNYADIKPSSNEVLRDKEASAGPFSIAYIGEKFDGVIPYLKDKNKIGDGAHMITYQKVVPDEIPNYFLWAFHSKSEGLPAVDEEYVAVIWTKEDPNCVFGLLCIEPIHFFFDENPFHIPYELSAVRMYSRNTHSHVFKRYGSVREQLLEKNIVEDDFLDFDEFLQDLYRDGILKEDGYAGVPEGWGH